jgi:hypothetical protein
MNSGALKCVQRDVDARLPHLEVAVVLCCVVVQLSLCVCGKCRCDLARRMFSRQQKSV